MAVDPVEYYSRRSVAEEVAEFLRGRWAALEGREKWWLRWRHGRPLVVSSWRDVVELVREYRGFGARSWYGTIEVFRKLRERRDVEEGYEGNIERVTVFVDIDIVDESRLGDAWGCVVEAARVLVEWLEGKGVRESVYLLWSGAGMHVRVHEAAFEKVLEEAHPLDVAFAVAEYMLEASEAELLRVIEGCGGLVKVENLVAPKRVFTAPLSLHRRLDRVAVALKPERLGEFSLDWSSPENPVHDPGAWRRFRRGEADELAREALERIGRVKKRALMEARATRLALPVAGEARAVGRAQAAGTPREPGRFQVMALLQAARYYLLTGDMERAKSWGLNRAIFYAWAKYYGPSRRPVAAIERRAARYSSGARVREEEARWVEVGGEKAMVSPRGWFVIGGVEQRPEDFDRYVARRFEEAGISFKEAWEAALEYLRRFPPSVLRDPRRFYKEVYEPVRDRFVDRVLKRFRSSGETGEKATEKTEGGLDRWLKLGKRKE